MGILMAGAWEGVDHLRAILAQGASGRLLTGTFSPTFHYLPFAKWLGSLQEGVDFCVASRPRRPPARSYGTDT